MGKHDKLLKKLLAKPKTFTYDDLRTVLSSLGYEESQKGKTSGSRVAFYHPADGDIILIHKPHPGNELKKYVINNVVKALKEKGVT
jgi:predicted RNA binding protein YcfA (HicA-like mRNA interferase family)